MISRASRDRRGISAASPWPHATWARPRVPSQHGASCGSLVESGLAAGLHRPPLRRRGDAHRFLTLESASCAGPLRPAVGQALAKIWANRGELLSLVDHAPSTLCHMDLWPPNLFSDPDPARADDCTIAIDWAYAGRGAVGEDIGNLIPDSVMDGFVSPADAPTLAEEVFESYVEGLRRSGCRIDAAIVRFVCGTVMAVKYVWMTPRMLQLADDIQQSLEIDAIDNMPLQQAFAARAASAAITARFGLEALSKVDRMVGLL